MWLHITDSQANRSPVAAEARFAAAPDFKAGRCHFPRHASSSRFRCLEQKAPVGIRRGPCFLGERTARYLVQQLNCAMQHAPPSQQSIDGEVAVVEPASASDATMINRYFIESSC